MKLKRNTKFGEGSTCCFKISVRNLTNFNLSTQKSQRILYSSSYANFEITSRFLSKFCIPLQFYERYLPCTFLAQKI